MYEDNFSHLLVWILTTKQLYTTNKISGIKVITENKPQYLPKYF